MVLSCTLITEQPHTVLQRLFAKELERKHDRSTISLENSNEFGVFVITAQDVGALRAALNSVTSILATQEKTQQIVRKEESS